MIYFINCLNIFIIIFFFWFYVIYEFTWKKINNINILRRILSIFIISDYALSIGSIW